jgi:hypothetical protein
MKCQEFSRIALLWLYLLGGVVAGAHAVELAASRTLAVLGRPLDARINIKLDQVEEDPCLQAQVFFAETRTNALTQWTPASGNPAQGVLRVTTSAAVDEPIVTVYVTVGCSARVSRKFVFFAEMDVPAVPAAVRHTQTPDAPGMPQKSADPPAPTQPKSAGRKPAPPSPQASRDPVQEAPAIKAAGGARTAKPRLKLEPLDVQATPGLRHTMQLSVPAVPADEATRAVASALWKAISASPEEVLRDAQRLHALENQLTQMQSRLVAQQQTIDRFQQDMDQQKNYVMALLVMACLAVLSVGAMWWRRRQAGNVAVPWWKEHKPAAWFKDALPLGRLGRGAAAARGEKEDDALDDHEPRVMSRVVPGVKTAGEGISQTEAVSVDPAVGMVAAHARTKVGESDMELDFSQTGRVPVSTPRVTPEEAPGGVPQKEPTPVASALPAGDHFLGMDLSGKHYDVQELFDVQEQSEFFVTVGQFDQAIEVLRNHIEANPEASPLAYLDLFALFHQLGRRDDYDTLAGKFVGHFNAKIPGFDQYASETRRDLEHYTAAITRIQLLWPSEKTLNVIAESIFRKPDTSDSAFSLEAYRDLLLLYGILKELQEDAPPAPDFVASGYQDSSFGNSGFQSTRMEALPTIDSMPGTDDYWASVESSSREALLEFDVYTPKSRRIGLDIDLASPESIGEEKPRADRSRR